jgi:Fe-S oxidoreductase
MSPYRRPGIVTSTKNILDKCNVDYDVLSDEPCCGSFLFRTGQLKAAKERVRRNFEYFKSNGVEKIVTFCPGCYRAFTRDYPSVEPRFDIEVQHISQKLKNLLDSGKLVFKNSVPMKVTYHDPCHLGRHCGVYDEPRAVIKAIPGIEFFELTRSRADAKCCGAGGGVMSAYRENTDRASEKRINDVTRQQGTVLVTACPFCNLSLANAAERMKASVEVLDLPEIVWKAIR